MYYDKPESECTISSEALKELDSDSQKEVMRTWFFQNYEDPVQECPYNGREGGYMYIHGGPYDANEELSDEFSSIVNDDIIIELAEDLSNDCWEWSGLPSHDDYAEYYIDAIASAKSPFENAEVSIKKIKELSSIELEIHLQQTVRQMAFTSAITILEAYLSEFFVHNVFGSQQFLQNFVESNKEFRKQKIPLSDIFSHSAKIEETVQEHLSKLLWHNLGKIKPMFKTTFNIDLPDIGELMFAVNKRHDLVHRGGKTKAGESIEITDSDLRNLLKSIESLINHIEDSAKDNPTINPSF